MKIIVNNNESQIEAKKITIQLNDYVEMNISVNKFGQLVIQKANFGPDDGAITITPSVSNEIRLQ